MSKKVICRGNPGDNGEPGANRSEPIPVANPGLSGTTSVGAFAGLDASLAPPIHWLADYIHSAEKDSLNGMVESCVEKLIWISRILPPPSTSTTGSDSYAFAANRLSSIAANVLSGKDVFGRQRSYVPLLSFTLLRDHLVREIEGAIELEKAVEKLKAQQDDQSAVRSNVKATIDAVTRSSSYIQNRIALDFKRLDSLRVQIDEMRTELDKLFLELESADASFHRAVRDQSRGCSTKQVLSFAAMVVTVYATGTAAAAAMQSSYAAIKQIKDLRRTDTNLSLVKQVRADVKEIAGIWEPAGDDIDAFKKSLSDAQAAADAYHATRRTPKANTQEAPSDYAKIVANKATFDQEIEHFRSMPEAAEYKRLMDAFVSVSQARNSRIFEHDSTVLDIWSNWAQIDTLIAEGSQVASSAKYDYDLTTALSIGERLLDQVKWNAFFTVSMLARSLEYLSGERKPVYFADTSVGFISGVANQVSTSYLQSLLSRPQQATISTRLNVPLKSLLSPGALERLVAGEQVSLAIPQDDPTFRNRYGVTTKRFYIIHDAAIIDFQFLFEHQGYSLMRLRDGSFTSYTHVPVSGMYEVGSNAGSPIATGDFGHGTDFVGVSPYGPWRIKLVGSPAARRALADASVAFDVLSYTYFPV